MAFTAQLMSFNRHLALDRVGGDEDLLKEVLQLFLEECPQLMAQVNQAVETGDPRRVEQSAHTLKGSLSTIGAELGASKAQTLESMGRSRDLEGCRQALEQLHQSVNRLCTELTAILA
jgi:HPt (histidine-containing phosphotransfer) domain-containing protein